MSDLLVFVRAGRRRGLPLERVGEVGFDRAADPVPLAPSGVAGLLLDRGRLLTVLDLDELLARDGAASGPAAYGYLVRLTPPFAHLALRVRSDVPVEVAG